MSYVEVTARWALRARIRLGLTRMQQRGLVRWCEQRGRITSTFTIWGPALVLAAILRAIGREPLQRAPRGQYFDIVA